MMNNTSEMKARNARVTPSAIVSSVYPIRTHLSPQEQSAGLGTGEDGTDISYAPLANVVSFEMARKINALKNAYSTQSSEYGSQNSSGGIVEDDYDDEDDERIQKGRERNREHARRTRLRKKAQLEDLEVKYRSMLAERQSLNQQIQDRNIASILLGLASSAPPDCPTEVSGVTSNESTERNSTVLCGDMTSSESAQVSTRRKRGFPEVQLPNNNAPLTININGVPTAISSKSHINWKTGIYCDDNGRQSQMTPGQLEDLRRERNRMHAKMTRDRKKCFISTMEKAIDELESELVGLRCCLSQGQSNITSQESNNSKVVTPELTSRPSPSYHSSAPLEGMEPSSPVDPSLLLFHSDQHEHDDDVHDDDDRPSKRTRHGFSLDG